MARQAQQNAQNTYGSAAGVLGQGGSLFNTGVNNTNQLFNQLEPEFQAEVTNPTGIGPSGLAAENTAAQQSTGGAVSGAVGQGNLMAARTRNKGAFAPAADEAAREGMRQNSQIATEITAKNEDLKQKQQQEGLAGLSGLYGQNMSEILGALGAENSSLGQETGATNAYTNAGQSGWLQNTMGVLNSLGNLGTGVGTGVGNAAKGL